MRFEDPEDLNRTHALQKSARNFDETEIAKIETRILDEPCNIDLRLQLLFWYDHQFSRTHQEKSSDKYFEAVSWLIENIPSMNGILGNRISFSASHFTNAQNQKLQQSWLRQVERFPDDSQVIGCAASFIARYDLVESMPLFERAFQLAPEEAWLHDFVFHIMSRLSSLDTDARKRFANLVIEYGMRSLESEGNPDDFMLCGFVADMALELERPESVRKCIEIFLAMDYREAKYKAFGYEGLLALREGNIALGRQCLLKCKLDEHEEHTVTQLMKELFDLGERESIVMLIKTLKGKSKERQADKKLWLEQIAKNQLPDLIGYCCRKANRES